MDLLHGVGASTAPYMIRQNSRTHVTSPPTSPGRGFEESPRVPPASGPAAFAAPRPVALSAAMSPANDCLFPPGRSQGSPVLPPKGPSPRGFSLPACVRSPPGLGAARSSTSHDALPGGSFPRLPLLSISPSRAPTKCYVGPVSGCSSPGPCLGRSSTLISGTWWSSFNRRPGESGWGVPRGAPAFWHMLWGLCASSMGAFWRRSPLGYIRR